MTDFLNAYKNLDCKELYGSVSGRASRKDYFLYYFVPVFFAGIAIGLINGILMSLSSSPAIAWLSFLFSAVIAVASMWIGIVMTVKRLHDWDKSAWMLLIFLIPIVGFIFWFSLFFVNGTAGPNRFGAATA